MGEEMITTLEEFVNSLRDIGQEVGEPGLYYYTSSGWGLEMKPAVNGKMEAVLKVTINLDQAEGD